MALGTHRVCESRRVGDEPDLHGRGDEEERQKPRDGRRGFYLISAALFSERKPSLSSDHALGRPPYRHIMPPREFVTLGMFIVDEFSFQDEHGVPTGRVLAPQEG